MLFDVNSVIENKFVQEDNLLLSFISKENKHPNDLRKTGLPNFLLFFRYTSTFHKFSNTIINDGSAMASMRRCCDWVSNFTFTIFQHSGEL